MKELISVLFYEQNMAVTFTSCVYFMNKNTLSRDYYGMRRHVT